MFTELMASGSGGRGNVDRLIYIDDVGVNNGYWFQDYDNEILTITSGALRTGPGSNGDVTFTASKGGVLHIRQGNAYTNEGSVSLYVNGTIVAGNNKKNRYYCKYIGRRYNSLGL